MLPTLVRIDADAPSALALSGALPPELIAADQAFPILILDAGGRVVRANAHFLKVHGTTAVQLAGQPLEAFTVLPGEGRQWGTAWGQVHEATPGPALLEIGRRDATGNMRWYQAAYTRLDANHDGPGHWAEVAMDITERVLRGADVRGQHAAMHASSSVAEFALDGTVLDANAHFLEAMGYALHEVQGRHHRMFMPAAEARSPAYAEFWSQLARGGHHSDEFRRVGKHGREVWLRATYNAVLDPEGRPRKIVQYAVDVTVERMRQAEFQWHIAALHRSHCVITFDRHGVVLDANAAMLDALGYVADEVVGRHHRMFVEPSYAHGSEYAAFWRGLGAGQYQTGQYRRLGKGGREVWLQANYSPIFDGSGELVKVVKYASVITDEKHRQAEHQGQIAAIHKALCVISFDLDGTICDANDNFLEAMGYRLSDVRGRHHRMFVDAQTAGSQRYQDFWRALARGEYQSGEYRRVGRDGREVWLQATYNPIFDGSGRPIRVVKYATDVTLQKLQQADAQSQINAIHKSQGVVTFGTDGTILDANENFLDALGYTLEELTGRHHRMLVGPDESSHPDYLAFWETLRAGQFVSGRYRRLSRDGRQVWLQASYNPVFDLNGKLWKIVKFATDVTADVALAEAFEDAKRQAQHDPATSLPNRTRLASFMTAALKVPEARLAVMYIDLDRFKPVNDTYGHHVGDRVLGEIADRLRRTLQGDQLVARVGGDEFVIAAPGISDDALESHCQQVIEVVQQSIRYEAAELTVGASIGVAISPGDGTTPDDLLRAADSALYRAKEQGRGTYRFFSTDMDERIHANRRMTEDMRRGIADGEFFLEFQPRFDASSQSIRSAEALIRWAHPQLGRIPPDRFIPLAERNGLIVALGDWVLQAACRAAARWPGLGVSVNVSPVQFRDGQLVERIRRTLAETGVEAGRLEVEITEGVLMEDAELAAQTLTALKALGVKLAIDDFGTGYSSLSYLQQFPFDVIKIDRSFISDLELRAGSRDIVKAILALARALGLSVTAEGVETAGQLRMLVEDDCAEVQGFLLSRPIQAVEIDALIDPAPVPPLKIVG